MILYLGLDPARFSKKQDLIHYPVIRTEKIISEELRKAKEIEDQFTHILFTSRTTVRYWAEEGSFSGKKLIAIGKATADALYRIKPFLGVPLIALEETQEGVIKLLEKMDLSGAYLFYPKSKKARKDLSLYLQARKIRFFPLDLYDTHMQMPEPVPSLKNISEIVFTSPTTVSAFFHIFKNVPQGIVLTAIGPVTKRFLDRMLRTTNLSLGFVSQKSLRDLSETNPKLRLLVKFPCI